MRKVGQTTSKYKKRLADNQIHKPSIIIGEKVSL